MALGIKVPEMEYSVKKTRDLADLIDADDKDVDNIAKGCRSSNQEEHMAENVHLEDHEIKANRIDETICEALKAIHRGKGVGFPELILNLYRGCSHGCLYCYNNKEYNRRKRLDDPQYDDLYDKLMKKASMKNIQHDLNFLDTIQNKMPVVISNWGDPYDTGRRDSNKPEGLFK
jgi:DNA repair photolyase